jgi:ribosomal protein L29
MKPNRIMVALAVCFLLTACGKDKPPVLPKPAESAKPASVESAAAGIKLNTAQPVVATAPPAAAQASQSLQTPPPIPVSPVPLPPGASAADVQALREAFDRQKEADKVSIEELQSKLATLAQRLAVLEAKPASQPVANQAGLPKKARKPKAHVVPAKRSAAKIRPRRSADTAPTLPFFVGSVDTWEGEKEVMVRSGGQWQGLKPGDTRDGWRIESTDGQAVTVRSPQGKLWQIQARQGG